MTFFMLAISLLIHLIGGGLIAFSIWYMLLIFLKPLKIEKLFDIELPLPVAISLLGIGIWYGINVSNFEIKRRGATKFQNEETSTTAYICTGTTSKKYHCDRYCQGLSHCTGEIEEISEEDAEDMGRTPCKMCY